MHSLRGGSALSDPIDPLAIGGSGAAGVAFATLLARFFKSSDVSDLKHEFRESQTEFKQEMKVSFQEQRADMREALAGLRELMARNDERHDRAIEEVANLRRDVAALHQRLDLIERDVKGLERER